MFLKKIIVVAIALCLLLSLGNAMAVEYVAQIGNTKYTTLQSAFDAATPGAMVEVIADINDSATLESGKSLTLNVGSHTITSSLEDTISNKGNLIITGSGTISSTGKGKGALVAYPGASTILNGCTYVASDWYSIKNMGNMEISSPTVVETKVVSTPSSGASLIANGWYGNKPTDRDTEYKDKPAKLTIYSGTFDGGMNTVKNDDGGELLIESGTFTNTVGPAVLNWNVATINGGNFHSHASVLANGYLNDFKDKGIFTINGGFFSAYDSSGNNGALFGYGLGSKNGGHIVINDGTFCGIATPVTNSTMDVNFAMLINHEPQSAFVGKDNTYARVTDKSNASYYFVGTSKEVSGQVDSFIKDGDVVTVLQGSVALEDVDKVVTVKNEGGTVVVNGKTVAQGETYVTSSAQPSTTLPRTGDTTPLSLAVTLMLLSLAGAGMLIWRKRLN